MTSSDVSITPLRCGVLTSAGEAFVPGWAGPIDLQVWAFLVTHPRGSVLFDTGMHPEVRDDAAGRLGGVADLFEIDYEADDSIVAQLESADTDPASVDAIVCSHLHFDHAGGNALLPDARVIVQRAEWEHARHESGSGYAPADWDTGQDLDLVDGERDLFGDGAVTLVPTYGHTPGHQSLRVQVNGRDVMLTADACYLRASLEQRALPAFGWDLELQREVFERFAQFERGGGVLVFGHDPTLGTAATPLLVNP
jgi:glyoxylase-like metal-dependent hydrolase (beta-lactamase superfamily II)